MKNGLHTLERYLQLKAIQVKVIQLFIIFILSNFQIREPPINIRRQYQPQFLILINLDLLIMLDET